MKKELILCDPFQFQFFTALSLGVQLVVFNRNVKLLAFGVFIHACVTLQNQEFYVDFIWLLRLSNGQSRHFFRYVGW